MKKAIYPALLVIFTMMLTSITSSQAVPAQSTYYACVKKSSGAIKMTTASKSCGKGYTKINWNNTGPQGPAGADGESGDPGQDGGYEVMLNPSDFATFSFSTLTDLEQLYVSSYPRSVWAIQHANTGTETIMASFPTPSSWTGATSAKVTLYWYAESSSGNIVLLAMGTGVSEGGDLGNLTTNGPALFDGTPSTSSTLISSETTIPIGTNTEMIDVAILRYMNGGIDTNSGRVLILAAKVEPIFP